MSGVIFVPVLVPVIVGPGILNHPGHNMMYKQLSAPSLTANMCKNCHFRRTKNGSEFCHNPECGPEYKATHFKRQKSGPIEIVSMCPACGKKPNSIYDPYCSWN